MSWTRVLFRRKWKCSLVRTWRLRSARPKELFSRAHSLLLTRVAVRRACSGIACGLGHRVRPPAGGPRPKWISKRQSRLAGSPRTELVQESSASPRVGNSPANSVCVYEPSARSLPPDSGLRIADISQPAKRTARKELGGRWAKRCEASLLWRLLRFMPSSAGRPISDRLLAPQTSRP